MQVINVSPSSCSETMGAAIAGELYKNGKVELMCHGDGSVARVFSSINVAKECLCDQYTVELVRAIVKGCDGAFLIKAVRTE